MRDEFLNDEQQIAEERVRADDQDVLSLQRPIRELPELQPVVSVPPETLVAEAVRMMVKRGVGCLLVTEQDQLVGLFTERDVMTKVVANAIDATVTPISSLMTREPDVLSVDSPLVFALHRMTVGGYRHVPLLNDAQKPVAVVSMRDIVGHIVELHPDQVLNLPDEPHQTQWRGRDGG